MDLKMRAEQIAAGKNPVWDVKVNNGIVPIITGAEEDLQTATLAGFLELGTIKQLPEAGVNWQGFLTGAVSFGELDSQIRDSINSTGRIQYWPEYDITDNKLTMTIGSEA